MCVRLLTKLWEYTVSIVAMQSQSPLLSISSLNTFFQGNSIFLTCLTDTYPKFYTVNKIKSNKLFFSCPITWTLLHPEQSLWYLQICTWNQQGYCRANEETSLKQRQPLVKSSIVIKTHSYVSLAATAQLVESSYWDTLHFLFSILPVKSSNLLQFEN